MLKRNLVLVCFAILFSFVFSASVSAVTYRKSVYKPSAGSQVGTSSYFINNTKSISSMGSLFRINGKGLNGYLIRDLSFSSVSGTVSEMGHLQGQNKLGFLRKTVWIGSLNTSSNLSQSTPKLSRSVYTGKSTVAVGPLSVGIDNIISVKSSIFVNFTTNINSSGRASYGFNPMPFFDISSYVSKTYGSIHSHRATGSITLADGNSRLNTSINHLPSGLASGMNTVTLGTGGRASYGSINLYAQESSNSFEHKKVLSYGSGTRLLDSVTHRF